MSQIVCEGTTPQTLQVVANNPQSNNFSYQWYENKNGSNTTGTLILNETGSSYTPPTTIPPSTFTNTKYYYAVISFADSSCYGVTSDTAAVTVNQVPFINNQDATIISGTDFNFSPSPDTGDNL